MSPHRRTAALAFTLGAALLLSACLPSLEQVSPDDALPWPGGDMEETGGDPDTSRVYGQTVEWSECGALECSTIVVPLDWSNPNGQTITLAINRFRAGDQGNRLGTVVINPGGPGGSGLELTEYFSSFAGERLLEHYDIVGFDPRGVGQSSPVNCGDADELNAFFLSDSFATTSAEIDQQIATNEAFASRCRELTGPLIANVDTASAARDMDVIRALVGDEELHYLGFSYGSQLGATYAVLYPQNVGHLVLDGAVDFLLPPEELSETQASGFELALENYIADCISGDECPLPSDPTLSKRLIRDVIIEARDQGIPTDGEDLNGTLMIYGIVVTLYDEASWPYLSEALDETINSGTGRDFLQLANFYLDRNTAGEYLTNSTEAFNAISCLDEPDQPAWTIEELRAYQRDSNKSSPTFGWWFSGTVGCDGWPWTAKEIIDDITPATMAGPILIIGTTGDPATPIEWAESLSERLPNGSLLVYDGEGHTAYGRSNDCIVDAVDAYFVDDIVPDSGKQC